MAAAFASASFRAMGSACLITADVDCATLVAAERRVTLLEHRWSRFRPDSDVTRLNEAGGEAIEVDPATILLLAAMVRGWRATGGLFDPTLLVASIDHGQRRSRERPELCTAIPAGARRRGDAASIAIDAASGTARLPLGTAIDPGGIGKGLAADLVVEELIVGGATGAMASIGGDVRVAGASPHEGGWRVRCAEPNPETFQVREGGVATSGCDVRGHHVLDPALGAPARAVREATVVAGSAWWAEVGTKALMVASSCALDALDRQHFAARVSYADGRVARNETWKAFAG